jgi:hypothetical protein
MEDLVKMITLKNSNIKCGTKVAYQHFINQFDIKVRELEMDYNKLSKKVLAKLE